MHCPFSGKRSTLILLTLVAPCMTAGCAPRQHLSADFGDTYFTATKAQILNPTAPRYLGHAETLPGELALKIYQQRYVKSLTEEKKKKDDVASELSD